MKLPVLAFLALVPCLGLAQSTTNSVGAPALDDESSSGQEVAASPHHHRNPEQQLKRLTAELGLSSTQQGEIGPLLVARDRQLRAIRQDGALNKRQKKAREKAVIRSTNRQIRAFLTPEQAAKFKEMHHKAE